MKQYSDHISAKKLPAASFGLVPIAIVFLISLLSAGIPSVPSFPRDICNLHGKIKFLFVYHYSFYKDSLKALTPILSDKTFVDFNKIGPRIISEYYRTDCSVSEYFCQYDKYGNLIEDVCSELSKTDQNYSVSDDRYQYDQRGRLISSSNLRNSASYLATSTYLYIDGGKRIIKNSHDNRFPSIKTADTLLYNKINDDFSNFNFPKKVDVTITKIYPLIDGRHSYIYDRLGNWVTDSIFDRDTLAHLITRRYEYY